MSRTWQQLNLIHLSDIHFGAHAFVAPNTPDAVAGSSRGLPTLAESVLTDLASGTLSNRRIFENADVRTIIALTGDLTQRADTDEFRQAQMLVDDFYKATIFGWKIRPQDIFIIPGNHDLIFDKDKSVDQATRWGRFCEFYARHGKRLPTPHSFSPSPWEPQLLTRVIDQSDDGLVVLEINSSAYVQKGLREERRGEVDQGAIAALRDQLEKIENHKREGSIRIALVHHHPIVLPVLADAGEGYDSIVYADHLLNLLKKHQFHVLLHGHKHRPYAYVYDAVSAWVREPVQPLLVLAGGSAGLSEDHLPSGNGRTNTYNVMRIRWQPCAKQARIYTETRGLVRRDKDGQDLLAPDWKWATRRVDDRMLQGTRSAAVAGSQRPWGKEDDEFEKQRVRTFLSSKRNYPCVEIVPSLTSSKGYEAYVSIVGQADKEGYEAPVKVEWSAGRPPNWHEVHVCTREQDPTFPASFAYSGPMLVQARLFWGSGGDPTLTYIFARFPGSDLPPS